MGSLYENSDDIFFTCSCHYVHGIRCDICDRQCLNPLDPEQQVGMLESILHFQSFWLFMSKTFV